MQYKQNIKEACSNSSELRNCSCTVSYIHLEHDGTSFKPMYSINCSRLNLNRLPSFVPENTTSFHATDNQVIWTQELLEIHLHIEISFKITSLEPLKSTYKHVQDIYLDYNHIHSIDILESDRGSNDWLQTFRIFSLKGNKLTKVRFEENRWNSKLFFLSILSLGHFTDNTNGILVRRLFFEEIMWELSLTNWAPNSPNDFSWFENSQTWSRQSNSLNEETIML